MATDRDILNDRDTAAAFFAEHAGTSYNPATETFTEGKLRGAYQLADDEAWGKRVGVVFEWCTDNTTFESDIKNEDGTPYVPETHEGCIARLEFDEVEMVESLWSIADADDDYRRVVEAELVGELRARVVALANA